MIGINVIISSLLSYYLGSICTRISFDFAENVNHSDPNFIGAWYLGEFYRRKKINCFYSKNCTLFLCNLIFPSTPDTPLNIKFLCYSPLSHVLIKKKDFRLVIFFHS